MRKERRSISHPVSPRNSMTTSSGHKTNGRNWRLWWDKGLNTHSHTCCSCCISTAFIKKPSDQLSLEQQGFGSGIGELFPLEFGFGRRSAISISLYRPFYNRPRVFAIAHRFSSSKQDISTWLPLGPCWQQRWCCCQWHWGHPQRHARLWSRAVCRSEPQHGLTIMAQHG